MLQATEKQPPVHAQHAVEDADTPLVRAAKHGDMDAFEQMLRRHQARVFRIAQNITRSCEDAEEIAQETFLQVYRSLGRFEERSRFSTWLTRIAMNTALMKVRKRRGCETVPPHAKRCRGPDCLPARDRGLEAEPRATVRSARAASHPGRSIGNTAAELQHRIPAAGRGGVLHQGDG
jgi:DNA-directed RNA polymerase specialized sigma24 family protein